MSRTFAIFGAGTGLGLSAARRFGREGFDVALVGRRQSTLDALVARLEDDGVQATSFIADLSDTDAVPDLVAAVSERHGHIDVVQYSPIGTDPFIPATELTTASARHYTDLYFHTPVEIVRLVLPGMIERAYGGILVTQGSSVVSPAPFMSGVGPAMAATRHYVHSLHGEVAAQGVYVGALTVDAMIEGSAGLAALTSGELELQLPEGYEVPTVDPAELADVLWALLEDRDRIEALHPVTH